MTRFAIVPQTKGEFVLPVIKVLHFNYPKRFGAYCADNGSLWEELNDGKTIFENELAARTRLQSLILELLEDTLKQ